jgi:hypothetical protein
MLVVVEVQIVCPFNLVKCAFSPTLWCLMLHGLSIATGRHTRVGVALAVLVVLPFSPLLILVSSFLVQ